MQRRNMATGTTLSVLVRLYTLLTRAEAAAAPGTGCPELRKPYTSKLLLITIREVLGGMCSAAREARLINPFPVPDLRGRPSSGRSRAVQVHPAPSRRDIVDV